MAMHYLFEENRSFSHVYGKPPYTEAWARDMDQQGRIWEVFQAVAPRLNLPICREDCLGCFNFYCHSAGSSSPFKTFDQAICRETYAGHSATDILANPTFSRPAWFNKSRNVLVNPFPGPAVVIAVTRQDELIDDHDQMANPSGGAGNTLTLAFILNGDPASVNLERLDDPNLWYRVSFCHVMKNSWLPYSISVGSIVKAGAPVCRVGTSGITNPSVIHAHALVDFNGLFDPFGGANNPALKTPASSAWFDQARLLALVDATRPPEGECSSAQTRTGFSSRATIRKAAGRTTTKAQLLVSSSPGESVTYSIKSFESGGEPMRIDRLVHSRNPQGAVPPDYDVLADLQARGATVRFVSPAELEIKMTHAASAAFGDYRYHIESGASRSNWFFIRMEGSA